MVYYQQDWLDKLTTTGNVIERYTVSQAEYDVVAAIVRKYRLNPDESKMFKHIVASTLSRIRCGLRGENLWIPISAKFISIHFPEAYYRKLKKAELIEVSAYSKKKKQSREFKLTDDVLQQVLSAIATISLDDIKDIRYVNIMTGKVTIRRFKNVLYKDGHNPEPELYRRAVQVITNTGRPVNAAAMAAVVEERKAEAERLLVLYDKTHAAYITALARWASDYYCYRTMIQHSIDLGDGIRKYTPTYTPTKTGRCMEQGGGCQSGSRQLKQASIEGLSDIKNYDLKASQISILALMLEQAGIDASVWRRYLADPEAKRHYAELANMSIDTWKICLLALVFGASSTCVFYHLPESSDGKKKAKFSPALLSTIYKACGKNYERSKIMLEDFKSVAQPFIASIKQYHDYLMKTYIHQADIATYAKNKHYITNRVGKNLCITDLDKGSASRKIAAFILQGVESCFIHNLTLLGSKYKFQVHGNEHDGLVVTGTIPTLAIEEAAMAAGLSQVEMEIKPFYTPADVDAASQEDLDDFVAMLFAFDIEADITGAFQ